MKENTFLERFFYVVYRYKYNLETFNFYLFNSLVAIHLVSGANCDMYFLRLVENHPVRPDFC